jgi:hypothetical protein
MVEEQGTMSNKESEREEATAPEFKSLVGKNSLMDPNEMIGYK